MKTLGNYPGLPGLFFVGIFSAGLSSLSTGLNSISAVVLEDFVKSFCKQPPTQRQSAFVMRTTVIVFGFICLALVFVVEKMGTVLQLSISLAAVSNGPLLGIFTAAVMVPWVEGKVEEIFYFTAFVTGLLFNTGGNCWRNNIFSFYDMDVC